MMMKPLGFGLNLILHRFSNLYNAWTYSFMEPIFQKANDNFKMDNISHSMTCTWYLMISMPTISWHASSKDTIYHSRTPTHRTKSNRLSVQQGGDCHACHTHQCTVRACLLSPRGRVCTMTGKITNLVATDIQERYEVMLEGPVPCKLFLWHSC